MKPYDTRRISFARWERDFQPIYQSDRHSWAGYTIDNFRERWEDECLPALEDRRLWSCLINDDHWCIVPGNHIVNRDAYIITLNSYPPEVEDLYVPY